MSDRKIIIAGAEFTIPQPYTEGHAVTAGEARALNQLLAENVRNNMASKVKANEVDAAAVLDYATKYEFNVASMPKPKLDPVEAEARKIAKAALKAEIVATGGKLEDYDEDSIEEEILRIAETDEVRKVAQGIVTARKKSAGITLGSLGLAKKGETPAA